jgi:cyclophilin family peptidyl-prolyl cis-trans isomerase
MKNFFSLFILIFFTIINNANTKENIMILELKYGKVEIELFKDIAPNHVKRFQTLSNEGKYDGVVFHRVIDGFMAQSGDVKHGKTDSPDFNIGLAGTGGSDLPNLKAEFSNTAHERGTLSAARSADPNSANSQFFICLDKAPHLDRQYSAFGKVINGMEFIDMIKKGDPQSGSVKDPDKIISLRSKN